jgi:choline dehydrogenase-like flavoprotein
MSQVVRSAKVYDVCIIGSGAGGGTAAKVLTEGGLNVVMLEAGPLLNPRKDYKEHVWPYALPHRGADIGGRARHELNGEFLAPNGFWEIEGEPYTSAPGSSFRWFRSRIEGGRTNHYGRISLRMSPADMKARPITTRRKRSLESLALKKIWPTLPTEFFFLRRKCAVPKPWSRRPATISTSPAFLRAWL